MTKFFILLAGFLFSINTRAQIYGEVIYGWDFSDGIPDGWENGSESGIAQWEYRGVDTNPDNTVASQGSCGGNSVIVDSETSDNGFVIFDSNYWDDPIGPCGNIGSGEDPGPHTAWLTTETLDFSDYSAVVLTFRQQYRHEQAESRVLVSLDDGETWEPVLSNPGNFAFSDPGVWGTANLSDIVSGESNVRIKFEFDGFYYWWMLDDIALYIPNDNDLLIEGVQFTNYDGTNPPAGFGDMEYDSWPSMMLPDFNFSATGANIGGLQQTGVVMNVRITNSSDEFIFSQDTEPVDLVPGQAQQFALQASYSPPSIIDDYTIRFQISQDQDEEAPANNQLFKTYSVTEFTYARDKGPADNLYIPGGFFADIPVEVGNIYESTVPNLRFHSIGVGLGEGTPVGSQVYGIVYDAGLDMIITQTEPYTVNAWDINGIGDERIVHLELPEDLLTVADTLYTVLVGSASDAPLVIARSGATVSQESVINAPENNNLAYLLRAPLVRMHLFPENVVPGCTDVAAANFEPAADTDDGSCRYPGCTDESADNYDPLSNFEDASCVFSGCTDPEASNYDPIATVDDGSCAYPGCTDENANNYEETANVDDGSCEYNEAFLSASTLSGCAPLTVNFTNQTDVVDNGTCSFTLNGELILSTCEEAFELTFENPGSYEVTYIYAVDDFESSFTLDVIEVFEVPAEPLVVFDSEANTLTCNGCETAAQIIWYQNGEEFIIGEAQITIIDSGDYSVEIVTEEGCSSISEEEFYVITGVETIQLSSVLVYPNPANSYVNVQTDQRFHEVELLSSRGQLCRTFGAMEGQQILSVEGVLPGLYILRMRNDHLILQRPLMIH